MVLETVKEAMAIKEEIKDEYFFVGMSMGAVLAFLLTHRLRSKNLPLPAAIFLASRLPFTQYEITLFVICVTTIDPLPPPKSKSPPKLLPANTPTPGQ